MSEHVLYAVRRIIAEFDALDPRKQRAVNVLDLVERIRKALEVNERTKGLVYVEGDCGRFVRSDLPVDVDLAKTYGYTRRVGQGDGYVVVPVALIEEAAAGLPSGDSRSLLERIMGKAPRFPCGVTPRVDEK